MRSGSSGAAQKGEMGNVGARGFSRHQTDVEGVAAAPGHTVLGKPAAQRQDFGIGLLTGGKIDIGELVDIAACTINGDRIVSGHHVAVKGSPRLRYSGHLLV